ncbi:hypothetical protein OIU85_001019 [Salix viminalis]|uniref:DYW domain-containing protein n=1 Tax=Salix viminalis TaxID=40686 RepID=A0A9Q0VLH2_SALVM|nr:hypothetical protein OIU85_001019 [Salix viminalis]
MSSLIVTKSADIRNRLIQGFSSLKHLKHIHAALLRLGLDEDTYLLNQVLRFSFNFGNTSYSYRLLYQTKEPNIFLFNTMIRGLVLNDCFQESIEVYHSMRREGLSPDSFTFPFVLKACARVLDSELAFKMHSLVLKAGCEADVFVNISLVNLYAKCGFIDNAFKVFDGITEKNFASWTATISGYVGVGKCKEAIEMFRRLLEKGLRPDSFILVEVLSACKQTGDLRSGEWIDEYITEIGMVRNVFVATALVDFYVKCGNMVRARSVFDGMLDKNIVSWSSMIQGYASNGLPTEALDLFFKMLNEGLKPDCYAMVGVLCSCARLGALELGDWASNLISGHEFLGNPVLGTALIDMYAKCGRMDRAWEVFRGMRKKDRVVWNAAISGLAMSGHVKDAFGLFGQMEKLHRDTQLGEIVLKQLIALEPWHSGNYVLLSNIYSACHKWEDAAKIRSIQSERGVKKIPGYSWIEVDGVVHQFLVGDTSHPLSEKIYAKLGELAKNLKAAGYFPTTDHVLFDIEEEEK